jgi:electron transport complex, RnfABCDGE type, G subunit
MNNFKKKPNDNTAKNLIKFNKDIIKTVLKTSLILALICSVSVLFLSLTNSLTFDKIEQQKQLVLENSLKQVVSSAHSFNELPETSSSSVYSAVDSNKNIIGYVFICSSKGYGGDISVMTGIDLNGNVSGVKILEQNETPGLGQKSTDASFTNQFIKPQIEEFTVKKGTPSAQNEISAITGATITSNAVTSCVNTALDDFKNIKK